MKNDEITQLYRDARIVAKELFHVRVDIINSYGESAERDASTELAAIIERFDRSNKMAEAIGRLAFGDGLPPLNELLSDDDSAKGTP